MSEDKKKSPLCPPLKKGGDGKEERKKTIYSPILSSFNDVDEPIPPLRRGEPKAGGFPFCDDLKRPNLITNGYHLPYNPNNIDHARSLRKNMTPEEKKLWYGFLRKHPYRFLRQKPIDHYILDFYCAKVKLGIELDGSQHYTTQGQNYDEIRKGILECYNVTILRFTNYEIYNSFESVCLSINNSIKDI